MGVDQRVSPPWKNQMSLPEDLRYIIADKKVQFSTPTRISTMSLKLNTEIPPGIKGLNPAVVKVL